MNGVQGVASSNLVIPTRISGSCDGESRLPFLLNFFRPGLSSRPAVFSRAAGDSQSLLAPRFRGRIAPSAETPQAVRESDSLPRTRRSWLVFSCALLFASPGGCGKASPACKKEGGETSLEKCFGAFSTTSEAIRSHCPAAQKKPQRRRDGDFRQTVTGIAGHAVPGSRNAIPESFDAADL